MNLHEIEVALAKIEAAKEFLAKNVLGPRMKRLLVQELDEASKIVRRELARSIQEGENS